MSNELNTDSRIGDRMGTLSLGFFSRIEKEKKDKALNYDFQKLLFTPLTAIYTEGKA